MSISVDNEKWKVWSQNYAANQPATTKTESTSVELDSKQADTSSEKKQAMAALQNFSKDELQLSAGTPVS